MDILVIGAGVSGVTFAINLKRKHPDYHIDIFEHIDKPLKKVLATGNGRCNIANKLFYNQELANQIVSKYNYEYQKDFLSSINIQTKLIGDLSYPRSESAVTVRNAYLKELTRLGIDIKCNIEVIKYYPLDNRYYVETNQGNYIYDYIIFAVGGKSSSKLGSDGSLFSLLRSHGYIFKDMYPALCPIKTKENTSFIDGVRVKGLVKLFKDDELVFIESGEILFKKDGLSGIVIFNASRIIAKDVNKTYKISIDLLEDISQEELNKYLSTHEIEDLLSAYLHPKMAAYFLRLDLNKDNLIDRLKDFRFKFKSLYDFNDSQITVGGIALDNLNEYFLSKKEKNIYFLGEMLDVDGPCGGYNLMWAIASALYVSDYLK